MYAKQIKLLTGHILLDIANLFDRIDGKTCGVDVYIKYIVDRFDNIALFGGFDLDGNLVGYTHAERPHPLEPGIAYLPFSSASERCPHEISMQAVRLAEEWMVEECGATKWKMETTKNPRAMSRNCKGLKVSKEILMEKEIGL